MDPEQRDSDVMPDDLAAVLDYAQEWAEQFGRGLIEPEADWPPLLISLDCDGEFVILGLPGSAFESAGLKDGLAVGIVFALRQRGALAAALVTTSWVSIAAPDDPERHRALEAGEVIPSRDPLAKEMITIFAASRHESAIRSAPIRRSLDRSPGLGHWITGRGDDARLQGRFVAALAVGVRQRKGS